MSVRNVEVRLTGDVSSYTGAMRKAATETDSVAKAAQRSNQHLGKTSSTLSGVGKSAATVGASARQAGESLTVMGRAGKYVQDVMGQAVSTMVGFTAAQAVITSATTAWHLLVGATLEFDKNMRNVQSITGETDSSLMQMEGTIIGLSNKLPQSAAELSAGLYDIASSGFKGAAGVQVLTASATAASAGLSTTATAARAITGVINAYGLSAADATNVSDILFQTVNLGVISFDELAQNVGDFVGTASTLGVPIADAGAALAAMTLSGINAAESSTSLNRVMTSLIMPSDALASLFKENGYQSGVMAVKALGLHGVMELVRTSTGGTADSMAALFTDQRALKGALALTAAEGKNYATTQLGIADAEKTRGASLRALAEQQKGLGYQLTILKNNVLNTFVGLGAQVAPELAGIVRGIGGLGDDLGKLATRVSKDLAPAFDDLAQVFDNAMKLAGELWDAIQPILTPIVGAGYMVLVGAFRALSAVLSVVTGFLADNEVAVRALAVAMGTYLVAQVVKTGVAFATMGAKLVYASPLLANLGEWAGSLGPKMKAAGGGVQGLSQALFGMSVGSAVATAGFALLVAGVVNGFISMEAHAKNAETRVQSFVDKKYDTSTIEGISRAMDDVSGKQATTKNKIKPLNVLNNNAAEGGGINTQYLAEGAAAMLGIETSRQRDIADEKAYNKQLVKLGNERATLQRNAAIVANSLAAKGSPARLFKTNELSHYVAAAKKAGFDLAQTGEKGRKEARLFSDHLLGIGRAAGFSTDQMQRAGTVDVQALTDMAAAAAEAQKAVSDAFAKANDLVGAFSGKDASKGDISTFYKKHLESTKSFLADYKTAVAKGFDPQLLSKILAAGPEAGAGVLKGLVSNATGAFVQEVNGAERELARLAAFAAEVQRLATTALKQDTYDPAQLDQAIAITQKKMELGAFANVQTIADALKLTPAQVASIASTYNIPLKDLQINVALNKIGALDPVTLKNQLDQLNLLHVETDLSIIDKQPGGAQKFWEDIKAKMEKVPELKPIVQTITDPQQGIAFFGLMRAAVLGVPSDPTTTMHVIQDQALAEIEDFKRRLSGVERVVYVDFKVGDLVVPGVTKSHSAYGNLFMPYSGAIKHYARGGMLSGKHQPKIYGPGDGMHVFNEADAGGEALIPLRNDSRRGRATDILGDVANRFGMQLVPKGSTMGGHGGFGGAGRGTAAAANHDNRVNVSSQLVVAGNVYGDDHLRRTMADGLDQRDTELRRTLRRKRS